MDKLKEGSHVDWLPSGQDGPRRKAIVDKIVDAETIRIMLFDDDGTLEWVHPSTLEDLDVVQKIAMLSDSKTLREQLEELET